MHQGDETDGQRARTPATSRPASPPQIATKASAEVDAFFTGHSHQQYNCVVTDPAGAAAAGDPGPVVRPVAVGGRPEDRPPHPRRDPLRHRRRHNEIVTRDVTPDPAVQALVDRGRHQVRADRQPARSARSPPT